MPDKLLLKQAIFYIHLGWKIFPIWPKSKVSMIKDWPNLASKSLDTVKQWWGKNPNANIAILTGKESNIVVLDIDIEKYGDWSLSALETYYYRLPITLTSTTGSGGKHLIFQYPDKPVTNSSGKLGSGLDIRGDNGYIIAPPSVHPCGNRYQWDNLNRNKPQIARVPEWLLPLICNDPTKKTVCDNSPAVKPDPVIARRLLRKALSQVKHGRPRNETGFWLSCQLRDMCLPFDDACELVAEFQKRTPGLSHPYTLEEALATLNSAYSKKRREFPLSKHES